MVYPYGQVSPVAGSRTGTVDPSQFSQTGSPYTNPDFLRLYIAQIEAQSFDTLFGEEGMNNSIFGDSNMFGSLPSTTSPLFGGMGEAMLPSDIAGATSTTGGSQYMELIARSNLVGKTVEAVDPRTGKTISGKVTSVFVENGILLIDIEGTKVPPENLTKVTS